MQGLSGGYLAVRQLWASRAGALVLILIICLPRQALASGGCPLALVSGEGARDAFTVTFRNNEKLPIQRLEFKYVPVHRSAGKSDGVCREQNAMFFSATPYTVTCGYPGGVPQPVVVSVKSVVLADGYIWMPSRRATCGALRITPSRPRSRAK